MEILLALAAAVSYGVSDFAGGVLTRRAHLFVVFLLSQLVSFGLLLVLAVSSYCWLILAALLLWLP